jgi:hypothetical protein
MNQLFCIINEQSKNISKIQNIRVLFKKSYSSGYLCLYLNKRINDLMLTNHGSA